MPDDRLAAATAELYGAAPEAFTGRRGELAAAAREAGDRAAAKAIAALRRPTRSAWVVNRLARADPGAPPKLAELAAALRAAQEARNGPRLRELSAARGALVDALTAQALAVADVIDPPPSLRLEVSETLTAALADPSVAAEFAAGTLTRAVQWSGFGVLPAGTEPGEAAGQLEAASGGTGGTVSVGGRRTAAAGPGRTLNDGSGERLRVHSGQRGADRAGKAAGAAASARADADLAESASADADAERQLAADEQLARALAERAAQRREQYTEAQRVAAVAATAAAAAVTEEDRLEAEVRDLERRLTQARSDLAGARMRARHAEAAERRARQALERLPRE